MFSENKIKAIAESFSIPGSFESHCCVDTGHINNTYILIYKIGNARVKYLLQRVNTDVFRNPEQLMANIVSVTSFLRDKLIGAGGNPERETLFVKPTMYGKSYYTDSDGLTWRLYNYIDDAFSFDSIESPEVFYNAGLAFGKFQCMLADFPIKKLYETIPDFHNTAKRYAALCAAAELNAVGRADSVREEISFAADRKKDTYVLGDKIADGSLPLRVTHNDTKLNNVLFDANTKQAICVVDLDTVMPGLSLYDFGDAIRFGANTAAEDEKNLSLVSLDLVLYEQYLRGYITACGNSLTPLEVSLLPFSAKIMTFECGMRFLTDYLNGDTYFRIHYPEHNLDRCHTQFELVRDIERKYDDMMNITRKAYKEICNKEF